MKFSVIIPVYNCDQFLCRCINSVLSQNYADWELILVNDGSTDRSPQICDAFSSEHPSKIRVVHQTNGGVLKARRVGLAETSGDYICFLDSDDYYNPDLLECVNSYIEAHNPDLVVYGFQKVSSTGVSLGTSSPSKELSIYSDEHIKVIYEKACHGELTNLWSQVVKRSCVDFQTDYSMYYSVFRGEDILQNLGFISNAKKVIFIPHVLYNYVSNINGLSNRKLSEEYLRSHAIVQEVLLSYCHKWEIDPNETYQLFRYVFIRVIKALYRDSLTTPKYLKSEKRSLLVYCSSVFGC